MESPVAVAPISNLPESLPASMEVHLVDKGDIFYRKGRVLAEQVYRQVWNTENLIDGNDYAVVVCQQGKVLGNMNLQLRSRHPVLKSEIFFGREHWQNCMAASTSAVAEVSGLAISREIPNELSRPIMMMLIFGVQNLCRLEEIKCLTTVQHEFLIRILSKSLHLPFFRNHQISSPQGEVPDDDYWRAKKAPGIYYLDPLSAPVIESCYSFLSYLTLAGIQTTFLPRIQKAQLGYPNFRKSWDEKTART